MTKISQLSDIGGSLAAGDEFVIRDISDTSTPNKKVTASGFIDYVIAQGVGSGFTQIAAGAGPLARALAASSGVTGTLIFSTASATTLIERARIDSSGRLLVGTTSATANGGVLQISNGITFPGTQSACSDPNTLDDYEEGTFTPTIAGSTTTGVGTYTLQSGKYVKVGGKVYVEVAMTWTAHTGTGNIWFAGLPFTSATTGNGAGVSLGRVNNIALTANNVLLAYVATNTTIAPLRQYPVGGGAEAQVPMNTAGEVNFSATYMVV